MPTASLPYLVRLQNLRLDKNVLSFLQRSEIEPNLKSGCSFAPQPLSDRPML